MAKQNKKWLIGLGLFAGAAWWLSRKTAAVTNLRWYVASVKYDKSNSNISRSLFKITIRVENPSADTVRFDRFAGKVQVKGQTISTIDALGAGKGIRLMPGSTDVVVDAVVSHLVAISVIKDFVQQLGAGSFREMLTVEGTLYAGGLAVPINQSQDVSIGKARVSLEFATKEEMEDYFQKSHLYVTTGKNDNFSLNGIGAASKKKLDPQSGSLHIRYIMANEARQILT